MKRIFLPLFFAFFCLGTSILGADRNVFVIRINEDINSKMWIYIQRGMKEAEISDTQLLIIHLNTYGGELNYADSIATRLINTPIPTIAFIDNNAASAGALISLACDKIYMRKGGRIGAATVVNGMDGEAMPDKYQSYMRGIMRSAAEAHGKDSLGNWKRSPLIAEAMVDPKTVVSGIDDSTKTLTMTTQEAIQYRYCEGEAESIEQILVAENIENYTISTFSPSLWDNIKGFLTSSFIRGLLITLIVAGIWYELQQPGIGFPLGVAIVAALMYFAPLYLEGLAANWEIVIFVIGVMLLVLEIFVIPGFGVTGISGILLIFFGLTLSLLDNDFFDFGRVPSINIGSAILTVMIGTIMGFVGMLYLSSKIGSKGVFGKLALLTDQRVEEGFIGVPTEQRQLVGSRGFALTDLRPVGKVEIEGKIYDALSTQGKFIAHGSNIEVVDYATGQVHVKAIS